MWSDKVVLKHRNIADVWTNASEKCWSGVKMKWIGHSLGEPSLASSSITRQALTAREAYDLCSNTWRRSLEAVIIQMTRGDKSW